MAPDLYGQTTALTGPALADWNATMQGFLAHSAVTPTHLAATLEAAPDFALGHATKGLFLVLLGKRELLGDARRALAAARSVPDPDPRTRAMTAALAAAIDGELGAAVARLTEWLGTAPEDALAIKLDHALRFILGDARGMRESLDRVRPAIGADHAARGYILGCDAFALEETGAYRQAEEAGHAALAAAPDDAWGLHAVAHVHDMTADAAGGLDWLTGRDDAWAHCNNFRFHVWWHKALMYLDLGRIDAALALYDTHVRAERTDDYRDIANATSLLCRLELEGADVGGRWTELAELSAARTEDGCLIFADLHYLMALCGDGRSRDARDLVARIARDGKGETTVARRMGHPGTAAAEGLLAFSEGRFETAAARLAAACPDLAQAGGSRAQRDVFERLAIDAGLRAGAWDTAERLLDARIAGRGGSEDGYAAARRAILSDGRDTRLSIPAE